MIHLAGGRARSLLLAAVIAAPVAVLVPGLMTRTASAAVLGAAPGSGVPANLRVGSQVLKRCATSPAAFCGTLKVPLDWQSRGGPDISVCYRWYPATGSGRPEGTVLPVEGVDLRGTGCSTVLNCPVLQNYQGPTSTPVFAAVAGTCADALNTRWRGAGGYVHASDLFTSAASAQDVAAVIRALQVPKVDVYGDSYGSWFAQVFAARYSSLVRSLTLDSTYQVQALDPWYRSTIVTMPGDFDTVCAQTPACAAARALLDHDRPAPLLRLYASRLAVDESYFGVPVSQYSVELYMALSCLDYPQLFPMSASGPARVADLAAAEAALPASTFAPFTTAQWLAMDQNTENYTACLDWPAPTIAQAPVTAAPPFLPPHLPVLILGGSLDTWTPPAGVPEVQAEIGGDSRFVEFANETHVVGEGDSYGCASSMIQAFVTDPATLASLSTSCAAAIPSLRAVGSYPASLSAVTPVTLTSGRASAITLKLAAAAVQTAGDAVARYSSVGSSPDAGLYGGSVTTSASGNQLTLTGDELVPGVRVSGTVTMGATTVTADLSVRADGTATSLTGSWPLYGGSAAAAVTFTGGSGSTQAPEGVPF